MSWRLALRFVKFCGFFYNRGEAQFNVELLYLVQLRAAGGENSECQ